MSIQMVLTFKMLLISWHTHAYLPKNGTQTLNTEFVYFKFEKDYLIICD